MTTVQCRLPVLVEVPVNHETFRPISDRLRERLDIAKTIEEKAADSQRNTERSHRLRDQHMEAIKERAARESQRAEEAAQRRRRVAAEDARKIVEKMEAAAAKLEAKKEEQAKKREAEKARRTALAEAASEARRAAENDMMKRSAENLLRTDRAQHARNKQIGAIVKKSSNHYKHALSVAEAKRERGEQSETNENVIDENHEPCSSPHPRGDATPHPSGVLGLLDVGGAKGGDTPRGLTPRQSPRRAPEMPTIREDTVAEMLPEDESIVEVPEVLPKVALGPVTTTINETLSAISASTLNGNGDGRSRVSRSFQRRGPFKVPAPNGAPKTVTCYEIVWDDGSSRIVYGL